VEQLRVTKPSMKHASHLLRLLPRLASSSISADIKQNEAVGMNMTTA